MQRDDPLVVVTGAAGRIGTAILPLLAQRWNVRGTDLTRKDNVGVLDVCDIEACRRGFSGADAVVHLAGLPDPDASWEQLLPANVIGAYHVAQAAIDCEVRRLVLASSLHAVSGAPDGTQTRTGDPPRPGNLYGVTKAWIEALGAWIAATSATSAVALRIGYFAERRPDPSTFASHEVSACLSPRDAAELVRAAVEAKVTGFVVGNGVSFNRYRIADLEATMRQLGYRPRDDAWTR
jgi:uronate dehydrogenase